MACVLQLPTAVDETLWTQQLTAQSFSTASFARLFDAINRAATNEDGTWKGLPKPGDSIPQWYHAVHREGGIALSETIDALCVLPLPFNLDERSAADRRAIGVSDQSDHAHSDAQSTHDLRFPTPTDREKTDVGNAMRKMVDVSLGIRVTSLQKMMRQTTDEQQKINLLQEITNLKKQREQLSHEAFDGQETVVG